MFYICLYKNLIKFVKYTPIMAITTNGVKGWTLYKKGGINHQRLIIFLDKILDDKKNKLVIMDNASSYRNQCVKTFIKESRNDYVCVLPYHHYQNPIEKFFSQLKHYMRKDEPMNIEEIKISIKNSINKISKLNLKNYFKSSLIKTKSEIEKNKSRYHKKPKIYRD